MKSIDSLDLAGQLTSNDTIVFDPSALEQLRVIDPDNSDFIFEIVKQYFTDAPNYLEEIISSISNEKFENLRHFAHTLKSSSATLGGLQLASICQQLESSAADKNSEKIKRLVERIPTDYSQFKTELENSLGSKEADNG